MPRSAVFCHFPYACGIPFERKYLGELERLGFSGIFGDDTIAKGDDKARIPRSLRLESSSSVRVHDPTLPSAILGYGFVRSPVSDFGLFAAPSLSSDMHLYDEQNAICAYVQLVHMRQIKLICRRESAVRVTVTRPFQSTKMYGKVDSN